VHPAKLLGHPTKLLGHPTNSEWAIMPLREGYFRKTFFSGKLPKDPFPKNFQKTLLPEEEGGLLDELQKTFRKKCLLKVFRKKGLPKYFILLPEEGCSGNFFLVFFKMLYFPNYLILINKLSYKINNIIIHKLLLVNIIMTNI